MAEHSLSAVQERQVLEPVLQIGVVPEQVELSVHWTQAPLAAQAVWPGKPAQSLVPEHLRQVLVLVLQMGAFPEQVALVKHCTQRLVAVLHTLVEPLQAVAFALVHCTHAPLVAHAAREGSLKLPQSESPVHAWHVSFVPQMGAVPEQYEEAVHWTQVLVVVSQAGVEPVHFALFAAVHCTQEPLAAHANLSGSPRLAQSVSPAHAWHLSFVPQMGVEPEQFAAEMHSTQVFSLPSHTGVAPVHLAAFADVHCTHPPVAAQAYRSGSFRAAQPASVQAWHLSSAPQMGVTPEQFAAEVHCTQVLSFALQTGVTPEHLVVFVAVHCTQAPLAAHANRATSPSAAHSASVAQAAHFSLAAQIGVRPEQLAAERHCTQMLVFTSQTGIAPEHELFPVHCTHRPSPRHAP